MENSPKNSFWQEIAKKSRTFFLPQEDNNYHPYVLHGERLWFYATSAILVKLVVVVFVVLLPVAAWLTPDLMSQESKRIVALTNDFRASLQLEPLQESAVLNQAAYNKAQDMLVQQYFAHLGPDGKRVSSWLKNAGYDYLMAGENLAIGFASADEVVEAWKNSPTHYANLVDPVWQDIGVGMASGLYNQVDTTLVAQFFGRPRPAPVAPVVVKDVVVPSPAPAQAKPQVVVNKPATNTVRNSPVAIQQPKLEEVIDTPESEIPVNETEVLAETAIKYPLAKPSILNLQNNWLSKEASLQLDVLAKNADKVEVYDQNKLIVSQVKNLTKENISLFLELREGTHRLKIVAWQGAQNLSSDTCLGNLDFSAPTVDLEKTIIMVDTPEAKDEKILKVEAYLSPDVAEANLILGQTKFALSFDEQLKAWTIYKVLAETEQGFLSPMILPSLQVIDQAGNEILTDLEWKNIVPSKSSIFEQYFYLKKTQAPASRAIFNISIIYYRIFFALLAILAALNIFVHIKHQHYKVILSSLALLVFIALLLIL